MGPQSATATLESRSPPPPFSRPATGRWLRTFNAQGADPHEAVLEPIRCTRSPRVPTRRPRCRCGLPRAARGDRQGALDPDTLVDSAKGLYLARDQQAHVSGGGGRQRASPHDGRGAARAFDPRRIENWKRRGAWHYRRRDAGWTNSRARAQHLRLRFVNMTKM